MCDETRKCRMCHKQRSVSMFRQRVNTAGEPCYENTCTACRKLKASWIDDREWERRETLNGACTSIYTMCAFGEDDDNHNEPDGTTAYLRLMRALNKGGVNLEE